MIAKARQEEKRRVTDERTAAVKELEDAKRDTTLFHKMKISATNALKNWAINVTKEAIENIPKSIDNKFDKPIPEHRWQRFSVRFKLLLFSFTAEAESMPFQMHNFLSMITLGKLPIPPEFFIDFEKGQLAQVIGLDRKLKLPHEMPGIK